MVDELDKALVQANALTDQLFTFAKKGKFRRTVLPLGPVVKAAGTFALRGTDITAVYDLPEELPSIEADEGQLHQVITNMVINAAQALPGGGTISFAGDLVTIGPSQRGEWLPLKPGEYVTVAITDQGVGMSPEALERVFDPYFTTKKNGNGLGLATCYTIVSQHGGHIAVESQEGVGTTFTIFLPVAGTQVQEEQLVFELPIIEGKGKVLVMDDDALVRQVTGQMLVHLGYEVQYAVNGNDAMTRYQAAANAEEAFDVVILDATVPGGPGARETIAMLLAIDSEVRAIVTSGYTGHPLLADHQHYGFRAALAKPVDIGQLSRVLETVMDDKKAATEEVAAALDSDPEEMVPNID